jgi:F-type H+-transporting ATPase subunit beta
MINTSSNDENKNLSVGRVSQVVGPVIDAYFADGSLPMIYSALEIRKSTEAAMSSEKIVCEVQQHIGNKQVRAVCMTSTDGLSRGLDIVDTGAPITVPVGKPTLGRIFNVLGEPVDGLGPCNPTIKKPIHRLSPAFADLVSKPCIFETGIKVIDL